MMAPRLHAWVYGDIARLRKAGIVPSFEDIAWLAELAKAAHTPPGREVLRSLGAPLKCFGETFYPFTLRARYWVAQWHDAFEGDAVTQDGIYLYAHVHSRPGDASLRDLATMDDVKSAVGCWLRVQEFDLRDIASVCEAVYAMDHDADEAIPEPQDPKKAAAAKERPSFSTIEQRVAALCEAFEGTTPAYWTDEISAIEADKLAATRCSEDGGGAWATSKARQRRVANYMNAVKWVARNGLQNG